MRLTMILPTLDERANLEALIPELLALAVLARLVVVDDGSTDGTRELVADWAVRDRRVAMIARASTKSLRGSLQDGIDAADTELVGWMDADGTMPVSDIEALVAAIDRGADLAVGSRFAEGGALKGQTRAGLSGALASVIAMRRTPDGALTAGASLLLNGAILPLVLGRRALHDWTSGFVVGRRSVVAEVPLRGDHGEYFFDLWIRAERRGARVVEVPCRMRPRAHGRSKTATGLAQLLARGARYVARAALLRAEGRAQVAAS